MSDPKTVIEALDSTSSAHGSLPAMRFKEDGAWETITWSEYRDQVQTVARGLMALGVEAGNGTVILSSNRPGWFVSHFASISAGCIPVGIYTNSTPDQCQFIANHCEAVIALVENPEFLDKILSIRPTLPRLRAIVLMTGEHDDPQVHTWSELLTMARQTPLESYRKRRGGLEPEGVCELIYTSGTTGTPKGVMLTHRNIVWTARQVTNVWQIQPGDDLISYLPLSHIAEQVITLYNPIFTGACTWFAENIDKVGRESARGSAPHLLRRPSGLGEDPGGHGGRRCPELGAQEANRTLGSATRAKGGAMPNRQGAPDRPSTDWPTTSCSPRCGNGWDSTDAAEPSPQRPLFLCTLSSFF